MGDTACRYRVPVEMDEDVPEVFPDITTTDWTAADAAVVAEMVMLPAPAPMDTIPAPEITSALAMVPVELEVVLPDADTVIVE